MSIVTIIIALVAIVIAWKILTGVFKIGVIALILIGAVYLVSQGMM